MMKQLSVLILAACLAAGCATDHVGVRNGQQIAFIADSTTAAFPPVEFSNEAIKQDAAGGMAIGTLVGAPLALACGPFAPFCLGPAMLLGASAGTVAGAAVGMIEGLPEESRRRMQQHANDYLRSHDLRAQVLADLNDEGKALWTITDPSPSVATVRVSLDKVSFYGLRNGSVGLIVHTRIVIRPAGGSRVDEEENKFRYVGAAYDWRAWVENRNGMVAENLHRASADAASMIVTHLLNAHPYVSPYKQSPSPVQ
jgi:hypothetical protein